MAPSKASNAKGPKKEKIFHPSSRKAGQLARVALRKAKMHDQTSQRHQKHNTLADVYGFYYHSLPETGVITLPGLHQLVADVWLRRFDEDLEREKTTRRKGRPKSSKEVRIEEIKLREEEEYKTGLEVIDLTHPVNVELFRQWDQKEVPFVQQLRFIRINSVSPDIIVVSQHGKHPSLVSLAHSQSSEDMEITS